MKRRKLRIVVMMHEDLVPPQSIEGLDKQTVAPFKTEYDVVHALARAGHDVCTLGLHDELAPLRHKLREVEPHLVFNLLEEFHGEAAYDQHVVSYLELLRQAYTGSNPRGLILGRDKALSKKILHYHRIKVPAFAVFPRHAPVRPKRGLAFPVIVKSLVEEGSSGISEASVVSTESKLRDRVTFIHESIQTDAIVEQFIEGRELYSAVIGNHRLRVFPTWELKIANLRHDAPYIATRRLKWDLAFQERRKLTLERADDLSPALQSHIDRISKKIYRLLGMTGYARIDFRLSPDERLYFLEANPNPDIACDEEFASAAEAGGVRYAELLQLICNLGLRAARR